jgi:hypothetical protein
MIVFATKNKTTLGEIGRAISSWSGDILQHCKYPY